MTPTDGTPSYETTGIALVLDPPLIGDPEADQATMVELISDLNRFSPIVERRHSWLFVNEARYDEPTTEVEPDARDLSDDDLELDADEVEGVVGGGGAGAPRGPGPAPLGG